jgi:hypothetical protein
MPRPHFLSTGIAKDELNSRHAVRIKSNLFMINNFSCICFKLEVSDKQRSSVLIGSNRNGLGWKKALYQQHELLVYF